jgi:CRISPR system Cascade subunit CasA
MTGRGGILSGFNVAKDPWIKCVSRSGAVVEVSMEDALLNAEDIVSIVDPCPLVEVSITRLLLAALHRIIEGPKDEDHWARVAKDGLGDKNIKDYFKGVSASLELFDDVRPFYQALVDPTTDVKSPAAIAQEMASGNNATLFDHTSDGMRVEFTPAEAARRLVTMQSYDLGGTHTGEKADPQNRRAQHAPLSGSVAILVRGDSLQRTLLMNLVRYDPSHEAPFKVEGQDLPAWEQDREPGNEEWRPRGYLDLLTYQSRRIRLYREGDGKVTGAIVAKGRNIPESFDIMGAETMIPFLKASEERGFLPMRFRSERSLWRDSLAMISASSWNTPWGDRKGIPPANINCKRPQEDTREPRLSVHLLGDRPNQQPE